METFIMPITVTCNGCEKRYQVKDEYAGKRVRCPQCETVVTVGKPAAKKPAAARKTAEFEDYEEDVEDYEEDLEEPRVRKVAPRGQVKKKKESKLLKKKKVRRREPSESNWALIFGAVVAGGLLLAFVMKFVFPPATLALILTVFLVGWGLAIVGGIGVIIRAFQEDFTCGILYLFVPGYSLYYLFSRWEDNAPYGGFLLGGMLTVVLASGMASGIVALSRPQRARFGALPADRGQFIAKPASPWT